MEHMRAPVSGGGQRAVHQGGAQSGRPSGPRREGGERREQERKPRVDEEPRRDDQPNPRNPYPAPGGPYGGPSAHAPRPSHAHNAAPPAAPSAGGPSSGNGGNSRPHKKRVAGAPNGSRAVDVDGDEAMDGAETRVQATPRSSFDFPHKPAHTAPVHAGGAGAGRGGHGGQAHVAPPAVPTRQHAAPSAAAGSGVAAPATVSGTSGMDSRFLSELTWNDPSILPMIPSCKKALTEVFKFTNLSKVQAATLPLVGAVTTSASGAVLGGGQDCFGKAKTGGGKTLAFLVPAVEKLTALAKAGHGRSGRDHHIGCLIISPTRELALQILEEAKNLTKFHSGMRVQAVIGGTNINGERSRMTVSGGGKGGTIHLDLLVGTPGRLVDHIENTPGFKESLGSIGVLVLDEADRLLDMGFKPQLDRIGGCLPPNKLPAATGALHLHHGGHGHHHAAHVPVLQLNGQPILRQTLLFSATVPPGVLDVAHRFLRHGYAMVDTVGEDDHQTNVNVHQEVLVVPSLSLVPALARILSHCALADPNHKIIVFFPTARFTGYMAGLFERMQVIGSQSKPGAQKRFNIIEMHSRKSQGYRTGASEKFRVGKGIMMFSSDVTARGMDYPDVSMVLQVGLTDREQYIHRLGRTARAGKSGTGLLLLSDFEAQALLPELHDLPLQPASDKSALTGGSSVGLPGLGSIGGPAAGSGKPRAGGPAYHCTPDIPAPAELVNVLHQVERDPELHKEAKQSYSGWLGFYNGALKRVRWDKPQLVAEGNRLFLSLGLTSIPMMARDTLGKMGLRGTPGLNEAPKGWKPGKGEE